MSTSAERLFTIFKMPKDQRMRKRYTVDDISKEALEKWASENDKSRKQIWRRRYNIKKHMRLRDAKEAKATEELKAATTTGVGVGTGGALSGAPASTESTADAMNHPKRNRRKAVDTKQKQALKEEQEPWVKKKKPVACQQLEHDITPQQPWTNPEYMQMMFDEYGGGCGVMQLMNEGIVPSGMLL